jgi:hypothetical protein
MTVNDPQRFTFAFASPYQPLARVFGVTPASAWVEVDNDGFEAQFGRWRVSTPLSNVTDVAVTGPYRYFKTAGPARLAITDRGLTFATNGERGVRLSFATPVPGMDRFGLLRHPELTVTVAEVDRLAKLLEQRRHPVPVAD